MGTSTILPKEISTRKISDFVNHILSDLSASESVKMTYLGGRLGLYKAMAFAGPLSADDVALRSGASPRLVREWLKSQTEKGYILYSPAIDAYTLPTEHAIAMTDVKSPFYIGGRFQSPESNTELTQRERKAEASQMEKPAVAQALPSGSARFFSTEYLGSLFGKWLPGIEGLTAQLQAGITVADLGCGRHGSSTLILAEAFPSSVFHGFDIYESSVERANLLAKEKRIHNAHFELSTDENVHARQYDLITLVECLHHMGNMSGLLHGCYEVLKPSGVLIAVEAKDQSRVREEQYQRLRSARTLSRLQNEAQRIELGIDMQEQVLIDAAKAAGFTYIKKVTDTTYDIVFEIRP
jgi:2-polyprenyl-3-methyl-5-hydroxy-6-metoxy-1,4-benzoquinol methylase